MSEATDISAGQSATYYDRIGGAPALREAVDRFYRLVLADPDLAPYFTAVDVDRVKRHQVLLFTTLLGGPDEYPGQSLASAHTGLGITGPHFDAVVTHLISVLVELSVPEDIINVVGKTLAGVRGDIVEL
jgi:hemoglobin